MNTDMNFQGLRRVNLLAGVLHTFSAVAIVVLANGFALPVTADFMAGPPGTSKHQLVVFGHVSMALLIASFFALSAISHFAVAGPRWESYVARLSRHQNPYRWVEYSLSSSIMIFAIAQLTGIRDVVALIALVGVNAAMQEKYEKPGTGMEPFWLGCVAGVIPWVAIGIYLFAPGASNHAPGFVYGIYFSLFAFFNCFALVQYLQYKRVGRFANYLVGERLYITLSLVAKSLLAWQIFAATLASSGN
jgi:hypothetical protein